MNSKLYSISSELAFFSLIVFLLALLASALYGIFLIFISGEGFLYEIIRWSFGIFVISTGFALWIGKEKLLH